MRHPFSVMLILLAILVVPRAARAQEIRSPYRFIEQRHSVGIFGGLLKTDEGRLGMGPEAAPVFGARYDIRLTGPLSGEVSVGISSSKRTVFLPPPEGSAGAPVAAGENDVRLLSGEAGLRFHVTGARTWRGLAPYVVATIGAINDVAPVGAVEILIPQDQRFDLGPAFAAGFGVGSDLFLTERISIRADARDHLWRLEYPARFVQEGSSDSEWRHNFALTLGGSYHF